MRNIISQSEWCITLLHVMLPVDRSKNYAHSFEFRQIVCPFNKHRRNKYNFGKIFKIQFYEVDINNNGILVIVMLKLTTFHGRKGNNSFRLQHFFDKHKAFDCKSIER